MQLNNFNLFPTEIFNFNFSSQEIQPLLDEMSLNKEKIKETGRYYNKVGGTNNYYSDFLNPTKLHEYEKLMIMLGNYFINQQKTCDITNYWTAIYYKNSSHGTHSHSTILTQNKNNYSSVLYLTNEGGTRFLSSNSTSLQSDAFVESKVGKVIFFPSNLYHDGINNSDNERIIISSILKIYSA